MPSKLRVEMHLAIDENSSAVQRCLPLLFINIYRMVYNSGRSLYLALTPRKKKILYFSKYQNHHYARSARERIACCVNICPRKGVCQKAQ